MVYGNGMQIYTRIKISSTLLTMAIIVLTGFLPMSHGMSYDESFYNFRMQYQFLLIYKSFDDMSEDRSMIINKNCDH